MTAAERAAAVYRRECCPICSPDVSASRAVVPCSVHSGTVLSAMHALLVDISQGIYEVDFDCRKRALKLLSRIDDEEAADERERQEKEGEVPWGGGL